VSFPWCWEDIASWVGAKISGEGVVPGEYFFDFDKTRHILLSNSANCTVLRAVLLTQYQRVMDGQTDGQTDGIAIASTALVKRRAVKIKCLVFIETQCKLILINCFLLRDE